MEHHANQAAPAMPAESPADASVEPSDASPAETSIEASKTALRRQAFAARRAMDARDRERYGLSLADHAADLLAMARPRRSDGPDHPVVAAFVSMGTEPPMTALLDGLLGMEARMLVPRLGSGRDLGWAWLSDLGELDDMGARRPREPRSATLPADIMREVDLVVMPALGVDSHGNRLGRGGGWYDRMLTLRSPGVPAVAVIYPWERRSGHPMPHEDHDMPVDATLTDAGIAPCPRP